MWGPTTNLGPIGSAVLTFIGYKQRDNQISEVDAAKKKSFCENLAFFAKIFAFFCIMLANEKYGISLQSVSLKYICKMRNFWEIIFHEIFFSRNFASFLHFSRKNGKFRWKVCEMRTKIFAFFRETFVPCKSWTRCRSLGNPFNCVNFELKGMYRRNFNLNIYKGTI